MQVRLIIQRLWASDQFFRSDESSLASLGASVRLGKREGSDREPMNFKRIGGTVQTVNIWIVGEPVMELTSANGSSSAFGSFIKHAIDDDNWRRGLITRLRSESVRDLQVMVNS